MIGVQFDSGADRRRRPDARPSTRGLLVLEAGDDVVRMSPPLVVSQAEADTGVRILSEAVAAVRGPAPYQDRAAVAADAASRRATEGFGASG